jgi:hypothetical protein
LEVEAETVALMRALYGVSLWLPRDGPTYLTLQKYPSTSLTSAFASTYLGWSV